jgi:hypothetical protein
MLRFIFAILTLAVSMLGFIQSSGAAEESRCASIEKLESTAKAEKRRIVLSPQAFALADCTPFRASSLDGLLQSPALNWWVLHTPDEDIRGLTAIAERNRAILEKQIPPTKKGLGTFSFLGADLLAVLKAAAHICSITFRVSGTTHIRVAALQQFEAEDLCQGLAVILAVHGISLERDGDAILVSLPN